MKWIWIYFLALVPTITEWLEAGSFPNSFRAATTDITMTGALLVCSWIIVRQAQKLEKMVVSDSLTGLYNSRKFHQDLPCEVSLARRLGTSLALAYLDLDNFKGINDAHSHTMGDDVLRRFGNLLRMTARRTDRCYRVGGDEFAVLMPGTTVEGARDLLNRLRSSALRAPVELERFGASLSVGVVDLREGESPEDFLQRADRLMYESKNGGKNRVTST